MHRQLEETVYFFHFRQYYCSTMQQVLRIRKIQELFSQREFMSFEEMCSKFNSSKSSIRRDLIELESKGVLRRVHGGALSLQTRDEVHGLQTPRREFP